MSGTPALRLTGPGAAQQRIRRSRFIGYAAPCADEAAARAHVAACRALHPKATHHVSAWRLHDPAGGGIRERHDDDGEPGGTAGRPVLQALEARDIVGAAVVVVRYFGGIKLGAGGLVRAYGDTAARALAAAPAVAFIAQRRYAVRLPFALLSVLEHWAASAGAQLLERRYGTDVRVLLELPAAAAPAALERLSELTAGRLQVEEVPAAD